MQYLFIITIFGACFVSSLTIPQYHDLEDHHHHKKPIIPIVKQDFAQHHEGYQYSYETGNGIHVQEAGYFKNKGDKKHETLVQKGSITYHDEHGHPITLTYIADEHGFQPQGAHLPTPPPIPAELAKALHEGSQTQLDFGDLGQEGDVGGHQEYGHY